MNRLSAEGARELLEREAFLLDTRQWDAWLALYDEKAVFWVPGWRNESETVSDPDREISLVYIDGRAGLEDRVWRISGGRSIASTPLLRTAHSVTGVQVARADTDAAPQAHASWTCHIYDPKHRKQHVFFGRYEVGVVEHALGWRIVSKKVLLLNDYIPTMIDFYCV